MTVSKALYVAALILFVLATIVGFGWGLADWHWQGLVAAGLGCQAAAALV